MIDKILAPLIDFVIRSYEIGYSKNQPEFYNYAENLINAKKAENLINAKKNEIIHIGDSFNNDYLQPKNNGWHAILYNNIKYKQSINSVDELKNAINLIIEKENIKLH